MAVDKKIQPIPDFKPIQEPNPEAEILIEDARREANADDIDVIQEDDGGATVDFDPNRAPITGDFYQNLAFFVTLTYQIMICKILLSLHLYFFFYCKIYKLAINKINSNKPFKLGLI